MSGEPEGRRERRWREVHDRVYDAALELFLVQGFVATSYDEIAERADVARKTAFNPLPAQDRVHQRVGSAQAQSGGARAASGRDEGADISVLLRHYFEQLTRSTWRSGRSLVACSVPGGRVVARSMPTSGAGGVITRMITEGQRLGQIRRDIESRRAAVLLYSGYFRDDVRLGRGHRRGAPVRPAGRIDLPARHRAAQAEHTRE